MDGDFARDPSSEREPTSGAPLRGDHNRPNTLAAFLMKLAGVDYAEALRVPANEQKKMVLIGAGLLLGAAFQATCIWTVLGIMFGEDASAVARAMVTAIVTGVLFVFDCKFVAADWRAQGLAYCRSRGLVEASTVLERLKRPASVLMRCAVSFSIAALVATLVMILVFRPAIDRTLLEENRVQNAAVFNDAKLQFERRLRELAGQIDQLDRAADALVAERASLLLPTPGDETIKRQIEHINEEIDRWRQDKTEAERSASLHESDRNAEQRGVRQRPGNTGQEGAGPQFRFHDQEAKRLRQEADARTADIETGSEKLTGLRREAAVTAQQAEVTRTARLATIEGDIREIGKTKATATAERAALHDGREAWLDRRVRAAANYKPVATDLSDRLRALLIVATASPLIFTLMTALKLTIMMIESAGPIAKVFFTPAGIYGMRIALRVEDAADHERDRREDSAHNLQQRRDRREQDQQARTPSRRCWDATAGAEEKFARAS